MCHAERRPDCVSFVSHSAPQAKLLRTSMPREFLAMPAASVRNRRAHIDVESYHVSCRSDKIVPGVNYIGFVLYQYDGRARWTLNGVKCRAGYILVKRISAVEGVSSRVGTTHAKAYKWLFGRDPKSGKVVGAGFAIKDGEFAIRSGTFNRAKDIWHIADDGRDMNPVERDAILQTLAAWWSMGTRKQTWLVSQLKLWGEIARDEGFFLLLDLSVGARVDAKDCVDKWYAATVVAATSRQVKVTFDGWASRYDEWIRKASTPEKSKLAPVGLHS